MRIVSTVIGLLGEERFLKTGRCPERGHEGILILCLLAALANGCAHDAPLQGPPAPLPDEIRAVRVTGKGSARGAFREITESNRVAAIVATPAFSQTGWVAARGRSLLPLYKIDLIRHDGGEITYWIGTNSHPGRFPCYGLCSGWWVAPSSPPEGGIDASLFRELSSSIYIPLTANLEIP
jgi:hypothetical protein